MKELISEILQKLKRLNLSANELINRKIHQIGIEVIFTKPITSDPGCEPVNFTLWRKEVQGDFINGGKCDLRAGHRRISKATIGTLW